MRYNIQKTLLHSGVALSSLFLTILRLLELFDSLSTTPISPSFHLIWSKNPIATTDKNTETKSASPEQPDPHLFLHLENQIFLGADYGNLCSFVLPIFGCTKCVSAELVGACGPAEGFFGLHPWAGCKLRCRFRSKGRRVGSDL